MERQRKRARWRRAQLISLAWVVLPSSAVVIFVLALMRWPAPTEVKVEVITRRVSARVKSEDQQVLLRAIPARSLVLRGFQEVRVLAATVQVADPSKYDLRHNTYPPDAWTPPRNEPSLVLRPAEGETATVSILPVQGSDGALVLDRIFVQGAEVIFETPEEDSLALDIRGAKQHVTVQLPDEWRLVADYCRKDGDPLPYANASVTLQVRMQSSRILESSSGESGVLVGVELPPGGSELLGQTSVAVDRIEFVVQGPTGHIESSLSGEGQVEYSQFPATQFRVNRGDFLNIEPLRSFRLSEISFAEQEKALKLKLQGVASKLACGPPGSVKDRRLSRFDSLRRNATLAALFALFAWLLPTLVAVRKFFRELQQ